MGDFLEKTVVDAFGRALRIARIEKGLTQEKLAFLSSMQRKHLGAIELGRKQPSVFTVFKLAHGLSLSVSQLFARMEIELEHVEISKPLVENGRKVKRSDG